MAGSIEVLENQFWFGVIGWRESFQVMFIPGSLPAWTDAKGVAVAWPEAPPSDDGDRGWRVARSAATDADGWMYGTSFERLQYDRPGGRASKRASDSIRSRLWRKGPPGPAGQRRRSSEADSQPHRSSAKAAAARAGAAAGHAVSNAAHAVSNAASAVSSAVKQGAASKATVSAVWVQLSELIKSAAERHDASNLLTLDFRRAQAHAGMRARGHAGMREGGWFFVMGEHSDCMKRQQLAQLRRLVWFAKDGLLGALREAAAARRSERRRRLQEEDRPRLVLQGAPQARGEAGAGSGTARVEGQQQGHSGGGDAAGAGRGACVSGPPPAFLVLPLGGPAAADGGGGGGGGSCGAPGGGGAEAEAEAALQLHMCSADLLDELVLGATFARAAYGYVVAAGHLSSMTGALKLLATLPLFDPISGTSVQANNQALLSMTGLAPEDVLKVEWSASDFQPCHYVAIDRRSRRIVVGVRGSLEVSDLYTDMTAAPVAWEFNGVRGFVHEGLLSAAAYVHASTAGALEEAARRCPGWPVLLTGHSLGGGVAALVRCVAMGPAATLSESLTEACQDYVTSVVHGTDPIPRLSCYSVECLLLDLVSASLSRRVTNLAGSTASATADAITSLGSTLARLARQGVGLPAGEAEAISPAIELASLFGPAKRESSGGGLKMLPSLVAGQDAQRRQEEEQEQGVAAPEDWRVVKETFAKGWYGDGDSSPEGDAGAAGPWGAEVPEPSGGGGSGAGDDDRRQRGAGAEWGDPLGARRQQVQQGEQKQRQQQRQQQHAQAARHGAGAAAAPKRPGRAVPTAAAPNPWSGGGGGDGGASDGAASGSSPPPSGAPAAPGPRGSASPWRVPGGPRRVAPPEDLRPPPAIFARVDESRIISGIQEAASQVMPRGTPPGTSPLAHPLQSPPHGLVVGEPRRAAAPRSPLRPPDGGSPQQQQAAHPKALLGPALAGAAAGGAAGAAGNGPAGAVAGTAAGAGAAAAAGAAAGARRGSTVTMEALREDLKHVVHLYPPGRVLWILSEELVGPAANQLVQAVSAHLPGGGTGAGAEPNTGGSACGAGATPVSGAGSCVNAGAASTPAAQEVTRGGSGVPLPGAAPQQPAGSAQGVRDAAAAEARAVGDAAESGAAKRTAAAAVGVAERESEVGATSGGDGLSGPGLPPPKPPPQQQQQQQQGEQGKGQMAASGLLSWLPPFLQPQQQQQQQQQEAASGWLQHAAQEQPRAASAGPSSWRREQQQEQEQEREQQQERLLQWPSGLLRSKSTPAPSMDAPGYDSLPPPASDADGGRGGGTDRGGVSANGGSGGGSGSDGGGSGGGGAPEADAEAEAKLLADPPQELQQLLELLGTPSDAGSAFAIAHKRELLVRHFVQQRRGAKLRQELRVFGSPDPGGPQPGDAPYPSEDPAPAESVERGLAAERYDGRGSAAAPTLASPAAAAHAAAAPAAAGGRPPAAAAEAAVERAAGAGVSAEADAAAAGAEAMDPDSMGLKELARHSLIELAQLPERIAESLAAWRSGVDAAAACVPAAAMAAAAAPPQGGGGDGGDSRRAPVVVVPDREAFSRLLLHRNAIQDHIPDAYLAALHRLRRRQQEWRAAAALPEQQGPPA